MILAAKLCTVYLGNTFQWALLRPIAGFLSDSVHVFHAAFVGYHSKGEALICSKMPPSQQKIIQVNAQDVSMHPDCMSWPYAAAEVYGRASWLCEMAAAATLPSRVFPQTELRLESHRAGFIPETSTAGQSASSCPSLHGTASNQ